MATALEWHAHSRLNPMSKTDRFCGPVPRIRRLAMRRIIQANIARFKSLLEQETDQITVFLVEQNVHQTLAISQHGYVLSKGRVVASGTPADLAARPEVREAYFG